MTLERENELLRAENHEYKKSLDTLIHLHKVQYEELMTLKSKIIILENELNK